MATLLFVASSHALRIARLWALQFCFGDLLLRCSGLGLGLSNLVRLRPLTSCARFHLNISLSLLLVAASLCLSVCLSVAQSLSVALRVRIQSDAFAMSLARQVSAESVAHRSA